MKNLFLPLKDNDILEDLHAGEEIFLNGIIYTARDQAHKRLNEIIKNNGKLPINLNNNFIFYVGPTPAPPGKVIGSCGPTTSKRMDKYTPLLLKYGLKGIIGKGPRGEEVKKALVKYKGVYLYAYGGCGALYSSKIIASTLVAFEDLGPEAIYKLKIKKFPVIVAIDIYGNSIYK